MESNRSTFRLQLLATYGCVALQVWRVCLKECLTYIMYSYRIDQHDACQAVAPLAVRWLNYQSNSNLP
jgi:hypothetical protein